MIATITYADGKRAFKKLRTVKTNSRGYFQVTSTWRKNRRWNLTWENQSGAPVAAYRAP